MSVTRAAFLAGLTAFTVGGTAGADDQAGFDAAATYRVPLDDAPSRGAEDALVTVVEFSDFHCQYCRLASDIVAELLRIFPRDLRVVYRHSLLDPEEGTLASEAATAAAAQGRFWPFHDRLFAADAGIDRAEVERAAREVGLDMDRFRADLDQARYRSAVRADDRRAAELGVSATPVFFVNGRPLVGAHGLGTFVALIDEERARAEKLVAAGVPRREIYHRVTARGRARAEPVPDGADLVPPPRVDPAAIYPVSLGARWQRRGPDDALVTVVEFGDYRCGFCIKVRPLLAELERSYAGQVRFVYRHLPLGGNPESRLVAAASMAAGEQGKFWQMHERLFAIDGRIDRPVLDQLAREVGLDMRRFAAALDGRRFELEVSREAAEAARLGVRGTPTFFINGAPLVGAKPEAEFRALIDKKLAEARALVKRGVPPAKIYDAVTRPR
ncbi:MAG TPA: thioredoxin domain-containing protein [Kofleriaceae bacterium]|nr:thioredoxin domain-containing protein [Kofleriaceae bacterium]